MFRTAVCGCVLSLLASAITSARGDDSQPGGVKGVLRSERLPPPLGGKKQAEQKAASAKSADTPRLNLARRDKATEDELRRELRWMPEMGLRFADLEPLIKSYQANYDLTWQIIADVDFDPSTLLSVRPDLRNLPFRWGRHAQITGKAAATLTRLSRKLRLYLEQAAPKNEKNQRPDPVFLRELMRVEENGKKAEWLRPEVVPVLLQLLMHEDRPIRRMLVDLLAEIEGRRAAIALAQRALYDLAPDIRAAAVECLTQRPREDYRGELLKGLAYPWAPAADHAAEALVALQDRDAVPELIGMLEKPDPGLPYPAGFNRFKVREVVGLRHVTNCLTCHPPAVTTSEPVPGVVPGVTLPGPSGRGSVPRPAGGNYLNGLTSVGGTQPSSQVPLLIRADNTYLRQDFSEQQSLALLAGAGVTADLRFDYLVRTRTVSAKAAKELRNLPRNGEPSEQRQALLFALRGLTGVDKGNTFADWKPLLPETDINKEADKLAQQLVQAHPARQLNLVHKFRDQKGVVHSEALVRAIPRLSEDMRNRARDALAERMMRMTAATLQDKLQDDSIETRGAALVACVSRRENSLIPHIIPLLEDPEPLIGRLARRALKAMTGQDFGPRSDAEPDEVTAALLAWDKWWREQAKPQQKAAGGS